MRTDLRDIINCLNTHKQRATYNAVGSYLGLSAIGVGSMLGEEDRPELSWIVSARTGLPAGHNDKQLHPELYTRERIISRAEELSHLLHRTRH